MMRLARALGGARHGLQTNTKEKKRADNDSDDANAASDATLDDDSNNANAAYDSTLDDDSDDSMWEPGGGDSDGSGGDHSHN